ncbi:hypothetical protein HYC85_029212 [Camellia sinensis]|uniref:Uncharacterized protein n=1 Tax=Camellia sinensis TaxID=4442 RepID=A0A7J7FYK1_CAMSI|nr:hypothetical protein HYC85_029212 [Camellia sinensis]
MAVDAPERPRLRAQNGREIPFSSFGLTTVRTQCHGSESNLTMCDVRPINHQRTQIWQIVLEN